MSLFLEQDAFTGQVATIIPCVVELVVVILVRLVALGELLELELATDQFSVRQVIYYVTDAFAIAL